MVSVEDQGLAAPPSGGFKTAHSWQWRRFYDFRANRAEWARRVRVVRREGRETGRAAGATARRRRRAHLNQLIEVVIVRRGALASSADAPGSTARRRPRTPRRRVDASRLIRSRRGGACESRAGKGDWGKGRPSRGRAQSRRGECECGSIARAVARVDPPPVAGRSRRGLRRRIFRASATKKIRAAGRGRVAHLRLTRASTRGSCARRGYPTHPFDRTSLRRTERARHGRVRRRFRAPSGRWCNGKCLARRTSWFFAEERLRVRVR